MKVYARDIYYVCRNFELNFGMTASAKVYDKELNINFAENMAVYLIYKREFNLLMQFCHVFSIFLRLHSKPPLVISYQKNFSL